MNGLDDPIRVPRGICCATVLITSSILLGARQKAKARSEAPQE